MVTPMVFEESSVINLTLTTLLERFLFNCKGGSQLERPVDLEMGALVVLAALLAS